MSEYDTDEAEENSSNKGELKKQRGSLKGRLTAFEKYVGRLLRMEAVSSLFNTFNKVQDKIEQMTEGEELRKQIEYREAFEDQYFNVLSAAKCITTVDKVKSDNSQCSHVQSNSVALKLPEIKIPSTVPMTSGWNSKIRIFL